MMRERGLPSPDRADAMALAFAGGVGMVVEPYAGNTVSENLNPLGRVFYSCFNFLCVPNALSQDGS